MGDYTICTGETRNQPQVAQRSPLNLADLGKASAYAFVPNRENHGDGLDLLAATADSSVQAAVLDPQYRGVLDKLNYGDEGHGRGQARAALPQMGEEQIARFVSEIARVLVPSGHLFLWVDKFSLFEGVHSWIEGTSLAIVDLVIWDKGRFGMGWRTRHQSEYLVVLQKAPKRAKGVWNDRSIPDVWTEKVRKKHAHSKPVGLQRRLIEAVTNKGDWVLDPAAGGYSVMEACVACNRNFIGCDIAPCA